MRYAHCFLYDDVHESLPVSHSCGSRVRRSIGCCNRISLQVEVAGLSVWAWTVLWFAGGMLLGFVVAILLARSCWKWREGNTTARGYTATSPNLSSSLHQVKTSALVNSVFPHRECTCKRCVVCSAQHQTLQANPMASAGA